MHEHVSRSDQRRLQDKENQPSREYSRMNIEQKWSWQCRMDQVRPDGKAETVRHNYGNQQRHEEIEVLIEQNAGLRFYNNPLIELRIGQCRH